MTKKQVLNSIQIKIKVLDISYAEIARALKKRNGKGYVKKQYVYAIVNETGHGHVSLQRLLDVNSAVDRIAIRRQAEIDALTNSIKLDN